MELFLIHGMGGSPSDWEGFKKFHPGKALSLPLELSSPEQCALSLADLIEQSGQTQYALSGYSMGGRLAVLTALELFARGLPPARLILVSAGLGLASVEEQRERRRIDGEWADLADKNSALFWERWYAQPLFSSYRALPSEARSHWEKSRIPMDIGALSSQLRHLGPGNHENLFPLLQGLLEKGLRVLYIVGDLDKKYLELSRKVGELKGAQVSIIPGAGHILPLESPESLASEIRSFLK